MYVADELGCDIGVLALGRSLSMYFCWMIQGFCMAMQDIRL